MNIKIKYINKCHIIDSVKTLKLSWFWFIIWDLLELNLFRSIKSINILSFNIIKFVQFFLGAILQTCLVYLSLAIRGVSKKWGILRWRRWIIILIMILDTCFGLRFCCQQIYLFFECFFNTIYCFLISTFAFTVAFGAQLFEWVRSHRLFWFWN